MLVQAVCAAAQCTAEATCPGGTVAVSGGFDVGALDAVARASRPIPNGWRARFSGAVGNKTAFAQCCATGDPACGNGELDEGEACDDGAGNGYEPDACRPNCQTAACGDSVIDSNEACDQGDLNGDNPDTCRADCSLPRCGDGVQDSGEACDEGANGGFPGVCNPDCTLAEELTLTPQDSRVLTETGLSFQANGGFGQRVFSLADAPSGGAIDPVTGDYVAGPTGGVVDIVQVTDELGQIATAEVVVEALVSEELELGAGWVAYGGGYRAPTLTRVGGLCVLSGLLRGNQVGVSITTLPVECRPAQRLIFQVNNHIGVVRVDVLPSGQVMQVTDSSHGWVPLDGIAFAPEEGTLIGLEGALVPYDNGYRAPQWRREGRLCVLSGLVRDPSGAVPANTHVGTLPPECRPSGRHIFAMSQHTTEVRVDVLSDGRIFVVQAAPQSWIPLDGIRFVVGAEDQDLELAAGWVNYGASYAPLRISVQNGLCIVSGLVDGPGGASTISTLPAECRPAARHIFTSHGFGDGNSRVDVTPAGQVAVPASAAAHTWRPVNLFFPTQ